MYQEYRPVLELSKQSVSAEAIESLVHCRTAHAASQLQIVVLSVMHADAAVGLHIETASDTEELNLIEKVKSHDLPLCTPMHDARTRIYHRTADVATRCCST